VSGGKISLGSMCGRFVAIRLTPQAVHLCPLIIFVCTAVGLLFVREPQTLGRAAVLDATHGASTLTRQVAGFRRYQASAARALDPRPAGCP